MFNDGASSDAGTVIGEESREMKCAFSVTIRRDAWGVPVAIMGQWIVSRESFWPPQKKVRIQTDG